MAESDEQHRAYVGTSGWTYDDWAELAEWVERLKPDLAGRTLYAFFNNDYEANAPRNALTFRELLHKATAA